jgi:hypothetical protein
MWLDTRICGCCLDLCVVLWIVDFVVAPLWELILFSLLGFVRGAIVNGDSVPAIKCDPTKDDEDEIRSDCNEREQTYIAKVKEWTMEKQQAEVGRVHTILQKPMTDELRDWARRRANILNLLVKKAKGETEEL